jgi:Zn-dependent protease with chaperone function
MRPVTGLRNLRLFAWFFGWIAGGVAVTIVFFPILFSATDPDLPFAEALAAYFEQPPFVAVLPGFLISVVFLGPVWFVLRFWIARQGDRVIGAKPATLLVWLFVWVALTVVQVVMAGADMPDPPPGILASIPTPFDLLFNGGLLVQMGGVTVMFLVYRWRRPDDTGGRDRGPIQSLR